MLTDLQKEVITTYAECGMNMSRTALRLYMHVTTINGYLGRIRENTGLNPKNLLDLVKLLQQIGATNYVEVVRCRECKKSSEFGEALICRRNPVAVAVNGCDFCSYGEKEEA